MHDERQHRDRLRALRRYSLLVRLYPSAHRQAFGPQMQQAFVDHYRDSEDSRGRVGMSFWLNVLGDAARSIAREYLATAPRAVACTGLLPYVPSSVVLCVSVIAAAAGSRSVLLGCALAAALLFSLTSPARVTLKLAISLCGLTVVLYAALFASLTGQWRDLFDPILLLVSVLFVAKAASGLQARPVAERARFWQRDELRWGVVIAVLLIVAMCIAALPPADAWLVFAVLLGLGSPTLCGITGARVTRSSSSIQAGMFAGLTTLATGLTLWIVSLPFLIVALTWITQGDIPGIPAMASVALHLWRNSAFWGGSLRVVPHYFPALLCMGVLGVTFGPVCGWSPADEEPYRVRATASMEAKPFGRCAGCGENSWKPAATCWCCGRKLVT